MDEAQFNNENDQNNYRIVTIFGYTNYKVDGTAEQVDVAGDYQRFLNATTVGMNTFCDPVYATSLMRPIALQLFCAPCSSAASERVFSLAGLIMRPHRSRLSKSMLAQLVFLKCNNNLL